MIVRIGEVRDVASAQRLLNACRLPVGGFPEDLESFFVATGEHQLLGVAGVEVHGVYGLVRSVAVKSAARGQGVASRLCAEIEARSATLGLRSVFLLTETAERFFRRRGYQPIERTDAPGEIMASKELSKLCPASAVLMVRSTF